MQKLKPCPFCGSSEVKIVSCGVADLYYRPVCESCGCGFIRYWTDEQSAIEAWNRRANT